MPNFSIEIQEIRWDRLDMRSARVFEYAFLILTLLVSSQAMARAYPFGFSIFAPSKDVYWQAPSPDDSVCGFRLGLIRSLNDSVCGLDVGFLVSETKEKFSGMALSGFGNITDDEAKVYLFQVAGIFNMNRSAKVWGLQLAGGANVIRDEGKFIGIQASMIWNQSPKTNILGFQIAAVNRASKVQGVQLGLCNIADSLSGFQIGLLNFNRAASPFYFFPGINFGF